MAESGGFSLDGEGVEAVCDGVLKSLRSRHREQERQLREAGSFDVSADPVARQAHGLAREAVEGIAARRLAGAAVSVEMLRKVFESVEAVRDADLEAEFGLRAAGEKIDGGGA